LQLQSKLSDHFYPQPKLLTKVRTGAKVTEKYDTATTPYHRSIKHPSIADDRKATLDRTHALINPAATQRQIRALASQVLTMITNKAAGKLPAPPRVPSNEATKPPSRAS